LVLEYDGAGLIGFQKNKDGDSVQSLAEEAVFRFCGQRAEVVGCGRTDAGVSAVAMPAHFDLENDVDAAVAKRALNFYLAGSPVAVASCDRAADDFHARFSCIRRHYRYVVINRDFRPVLARGAWVPQKLDLAAMRAAAAELAGGHDFTSFRAKECQARSPVKTLDGISIRAAGDEIRFDFSARSFLHHQVRNMAGTLIEIGRGKPLDIRAILAAKDRAAAGPTAPACGLFFMRAEY
jgi:tRNA pseudouridine38-40 synthase